LVNNRSYYLLWINHLYWIRNYIEVFLRMKVAIYIRVSTRDKLIAEARIKALEEKE